jgi:hypothetical protein
MCSSSFKGRRRKDFIMIAVIGIIMAIMAALAAKQAAIRKNRRLEWATLTFLFSPLLLILELLPTRSAEATKQEAPPRSLFARVIEPVGVFVVIVGLLGIVGPVVSDALSTSGLPQCDSDRARSEVNDAIAGAPLGRIQGISVIDYRNITTEENTSTAVRCKADAVLNTSVTKPVHYSFTVEGDKVMVRFSIGD